MAKKNMGAADRIIRTVLGAAGVVLAIVFGGWVWIAGAAGIIFLATAAVGFCPLYAPFKLSTRNESDA